MENPYATPQTHLEKPQPQQSGDPLETLPRFSTWYVVGLGIITLGIYFFYLAYARTQQLNQLLSPERQIGSGFVGGTISVMVISYLVTVAAGMNPSNEGLEALDSLLSGVVVILQTIWAFRFRSRLRERVEAHGLSFQHSGILTFLFHFIYQQYKINQIKDSLTINARAF